MRFRNFISVSIDSTLAQDGTLLKIDLYISIFTELNSMQMKPVHFIQNRKIFFPFSRLKAMSHDNRVHISF